MSYTDYIPEIGEAQYEAEQAMMQANAEDDLIAFKSRIVEQFANEGFEIVYGDNSLAEENAAMNRDEESYEPARQAHLMGAW